MAAPQPTSDPAILARLNALGPFEFHRASFFWRWAGMPSEIEWESPAGFENNLARISVAMWFSGGKTGEADELRGMLDALDEFRARLLEHVEALTQYVVDCFRECYEEQLEEFDRQRMADASSAISAEAILRDVKSIHLRFDATGKTMVRTAWIAVDWDEEHGVDVEWDEAGMITRPWRDAGP